MVTWRLLSPAGASTVLICTSPASCFICCASLLLPTRVLLLVLHSWPLLPCLAPVVWQLVLLLLLLLLPLSCRRDTILAPPDAADSAAPASAPPSLVAAKFCTESTDQGAVLPAANGKALTRDAAAAAAKGSTPTE
jgi:hypothetical protein